MTDDETYAAFITIMFATWDADEMAHLPIIVRHPSYNPDSPLT